VVRLARSRSELLLLSGGLGPTEDDITKQTVARVYGDTLRLDEEELEKIQQFFVKREREMPQNNVRQAYVPVHGRKLPNANGTAPGMVFEDTEIPAHYAVLLPGPPNELKPMFLNEVKPWLQQMSDGVLHSITLRVMGLGESRLQELVGHLLEGSNPTAALYAKTGEVVVRITARAIDAQQAEQKCRALAQCFYDVLGDCIYTDTENSLEETVVHILAQKGLKLATAESCTGGLLSARITGVPRSSEVFDCGVCTYANVAKQQLLGVEAVVLDAFGAVSPQVAAQMAQGVRALAKADIGVGITGLAGPGGGTPEKPVGLVYLAVANGAHTYVQRMLLINRSRETVRQTAVQYALDLVRRMALGLAQPQCTEQETKGQQA
jgi:nicotinamide-nucleotide amidase